MSLKKKKSKKETLQSEPVKPKAIQIPIKIEDLTSKYILDIFSVYRKVCDIRKNDLDEIYMKRDALHRLRLFGRIDYSTGFVRPDGTTGSLVFALGRQRKNKKEYTGFIVYSPGNELSEEKQRRMENKLIENLSKYTNGENSKK